ncbi:MAG: rRNA maturation RNase YbeY [Alphaproteobacteria bacterium]|nr:rRNA maturation RNase YbeY [Alphaproteobacteria bacterium]
MTAHGSSSATAPDHRVVLTEVVVEGGGWAEALPDLEAISAAAADALTAENPPDLKAGTIVLLFTDDEAVRRLNHDFRDQDKPTNVLSFPADPGDLAYLPEGEVLPLGDIALAFETCRGEAARDGKSLKDHVTHLVVHGMLHIFGYDHLDDGSASEMEGLEIRVLARLGVDDPY